MQASCCTVGRERWSFDWICPSQNQFCEVSSILEKLKNIIPMENNKQNLYLQWFIIIIIIISLLGILYYI